MYACISIPRSFMIGLVALSSFAVGSKQASVPNEEIITYLKEHNVWHESQKQNFASCDTEFETEWVLHETPKIEQFYKLGENLGKGGCGKAQSAKSLLTGELYAVKVIKKKQQHKGNNFFVDLRREIMIMDMVKGHPNIIQLEEVFEDEKHLYIVMEHCAGGELFDSIPEEGFPEKKAVKILQQLFSAVAHIHSMDIGHFDLKLENLMYKSGKKEVIKVIDFGFSKIVRFGESCSQIDGTLQYTAPEVLYKEYNKSADIWAIGIIAFSMIFNFVPFFSRKTNKKENKLEICNQIKYGFRPEVLPSYRRCFPEAKPVSENCRDFIAQCLAFRKSAKKTPINATRGRLTAEEALEHPWMDLCNSSQVVKPQNCALINSLLTFKSESGTSAKVAILQSMITHKQIQQVNPFIKKLDTDYDGLVSKDELRVLQDVKAGIDIDKIFSELDTDKNGKLNHFEIAVARLDRKIRSKAARITLVLHADDEFKEATRKEDKRIRLREIEALWYGERIRFPYIPKTSNVQKQLAQCEVLVLESA